MPDEERNIEDAREAFERCRRQHEASKREHDEWVLKYEQQQIQNQLEIWRTILQAQVGVYNEARAYEIYADGVKRWTQKPQAESKTAWQRVSKIMKRLYGG